MNFGVKTLIRSSFRLGVGVKAVLLPFGRLGLAGLIQLQRDVVAKLESDWGIVINLLRNYVKTYKWVSQILRILHLCTVK